MFDSSFKLIQASNLSKEIKDNAQLVHHFNLGVIANGKKDLKTARAESAEFSSWSRGNEESSTGTAIP